MHFSLGNGMLCHDRGGFLAVADVVVIIITWRPNGQGTLQGDRQEPFPFDLLPFVVVIDGVPFCVGIQDLFIPGSVLLQFAKKQVKTQSVVIQFVTHQAAR